MSQEMIRRAYNQKVQVAEAEYKAAVELAKKEKAAVTSAAIANFNRATDEAGRKFHAACEAAIEERGQRMRDDILRNKEVRRDRMRERRNGEQDI